MIQIRKSNKRGYANHGWLETYHTFSFAEYHDPLHMHFRTLRVINEDHVAPNNGFGMHPHHDMEIVTYVVSGELTHRDSMGNSAVMRPGDVQRISAGTGVEHSEMNESEDEPVHLLQIWIMPDRKNHPPGYAQKSFAGVHRGQLHLVTSRSGRKGSISINQDADLYLGKLWSGECVGHTLAHRRHGWLQLIEGELEVNGVELKSGDAAAFSQIDALVIGAKKTCDFLLFDLD